jgi:hypothetical protein
MGIWKKIENIFNGKKKQLHFLIINLYDETMLEFNFYLFKVLFFVQLTFKTTFILLN